MTNVPMTNPNDDKNDNVELSIIRASFVLRHSCFVIILHPAVTNISQVERRNRAVIFDFLLYESERKRFYEGRTASGAAISATRRRHWHNWA